MVSSSQTVYNKFPKGHRETCLNLQHLPRGWREPGIDEKKNTQMRFLTWRKCADASKNDKVVYKNNSNNSNMIIIIHIIMTIINNNNNNKYNNNK